MDKFKYILSPDNLYVLPFTDLDGNKFTVEIRGSQIISSLEKSFVLDRFMKKDV